MAIEYTIPQLLKLAGLRGYSPQLAGAINRLLKPANEIDYQAAKRQVTQAITGYDNVNVFDDVDQERNIFGLPVFMPLILEAYDNTVDDLYLDSAIIEISRTRNIVTTVVQGRDTSIKEFVNNGDYTVKVSGILASEGVNYPMDQLKRLNNYLSYEGALKVVNEKLNALDIFEIVVTDYNLQKTPFTNIQPFSFSALSEEPVELIIDEL